MTSIRPAVAGVLAAAGGLAAAELLAALLFTTTGRAGSSPVIAVGGAVIDATPTPVKEYAVRTFGTYDKPLLLGGIAAALLAYAATIGTLARRRALAAPLGAALFGLAGAVAAVSRPAAEPVDGVPSLAGAVLAALLLARLSRLSRHRPADADPPSPVAARARAAGTESPVGGRTGTAGTKSPVGGRTGTAGTKSPVGGRTATAGTSRRGFLGTAAVVAAGTAATGGVATTVRWLGGRAAARTRQNVLLPAPADPAPPLSGTAPGFHTRNADFYRVDTALTVPRVDAGGWRLRITGLVDRPREMDLADLLDRPLIERDITLTCVSNQVGGPYVGTARWLGVPLAPLLREAGVRTGADQVVARSVDGMTIGTPVETVLDGRDTMLAVGMNGEPLPFTHGFPVRMLTPGLYGYAGSCKWIVELELSRFADFDAYWVRRGWAARAPVKTASRIDRPAPFASLPAGEVVIAGVAWAQRRGIGAVQVRVDDGPWLPAELLPAPASTDTWVQWRLRWAAAPGGHTLRVRAVDGTGATQRETRAEPYPAGATGWHTVAVTIR